MKHLEVRGTTRVIGIIGDPIEHSISPSMHNAAFASLELDYIYVPFRVKKNDLPRVIDAMRALNIRGLNVTIPHKVDIIPFLDDIDPLAKEIGAVNVVVNNDGKLKGYNTDAEGFLSSLLERGIDPEGQNVIILGAGGAARAIAFILAVRGANLTIINRTRLNAARCAADITEATGQNIEVLTLDTKNLADALERGHILINATNVGMTPKSNDTLVTGNLIRPHFVVVETIYNPIKTKLLTEAEKAGASTINGLEMLIWQGVLAFEKWTGTQAPVNIMRKSAAAALKANEK